MDRGNAYPVDNTQAPPGLRCANGRRGQKFRALCGRRGQFL